MEYKSLRSKVRVQRLTLTCAPADIAIKVILHLLFGRFWVLLQKTERKVVCRRDGEKGVRGRERGKEKEKREKKKGSRKFLPVHAHDKARSTVATLTSIVLCNALLNRMKTSSWTAGRRKMGERWRKGWKWCKLCTLPSNSFHSGDAPSFHREQGT